jgi:hypothetical protein
VCLWSPGATIPCVAMSFEGMVPGGLGRYFAHPVSYCTAQYGIDSDTKNGMNIGDGNQVGVALLCLITPRSL